MRSSTLFTALFFAACTTSASAVTVQSTSIDGLTQAAFLNDRTELSSEGFEGFTPGQTGVFTLTGLGTLISEDSKALNVRDTGLDGRFATEGSQYLDTRDSESVRFILNDLPSGAIGIGFFLTDIDDAGGNTIVTAFNGSQNLGAFDLFAGGSDAGSNGNSNYVGILFGNTTVTSLLFEPNNATDGFGFDEVSAIAPVPLPAAGWMLLAALSGLVVWRRKATAA